MTAWVRHPAKRAIDMTAAAVLLLAAAPVLGALAAAVRVFMGRPVLFRQERAGLDGQPFVVWKLRTMGPEFDDAGEAVPEELRISRLGAWLRSTSLDELPQLLHVLRGDMSLVGPRPLLPEYVARYSPEQARRLLARPGITGLAQVNGRNALSWDQRFRLDVRYVDSATWRTDVGILLATVRQVVRPEGVSSEGHATSSYFLGTGEPPCGAARS